MPPRSQATMASSTSTRLPRGVFPSRTETRRPTRRCCAGIRRRHRARGDELQGSLKSAKRVAQVLPLTMQFTQCEQFIARARLLTHDEERILLAKQLEDGQQRLQKFREQVSPQPPPDWGAQVASLQQMVNALQSERDVLASQILAEKADVSRRSVKEGVGQTPHSTICLTSHVDEIELIQIVGK